MSNVSVDLYGDLDVVIPECYDDNDYITISQESIIKAYTEAGYDITIIGLSKYERSKHTNE